MKNGGHEVRNDAGRPVRRYVIAAEWGEQAGDVTLGLFKLHCSLRVECPLQVLLVQTLAHGNNYLSVQSFWPQ